MSDKQHKHSRSRLLLICGLLGLFGTSAAVLTDFVGIIIRDGYNPIAQTISDLAIGDYAWIQDYGLNAYAVGVLACGIALYRWREGGKWWIAMAVLLALLTVNVSLISEYDQYAGQGGRGSIIHRRLVYVLGLLFALISLSFAIGVRSLSKRWFRFSLSIMIAWLIMGPLFFFIPDSWDGGFERLAALLMVAWTATVSWLLIQRGRGRQLFADEAS